MQAGWFGEQAPHHIVVAPAVAVVESAVGVPERIALQMDRLLFARGSWNPDLEETYPKISGVALGDDLFHQSIGIRNRTE